MQQNNNVNFYVICNIIFKRLGLLKLAIIIISNYQLTDYLLREINKYIYKI